MSRAILDSELAHLHHLHSVLSGYENMERGWDYNLVQKALNNYTDYCIALDICPVTVGPKLSWYYFCHQDYFNEKANETKKT